MFAYKGFNSNLTCTMGNGVFQYEESKWYEEQECNIAKNGFHACENPLDVFDYYGDTKRNVYYLVEVAGDITEDGNNKLTCTRIRLVKRLGLVEMLAQAAKYMYKYPTRKWSHYVQKDIGSSNGRKYCIVRGKYPKAAGQEGDILLLLQEQSRGQDIKKMAMYIVGTEGIKPHCYYNIAGRRCRNGEKEAAEV